MEAAIFEVLTKAGLVAAVIIGFLVWTAAGQPFFTVTRKD